MTPLYGDVALQAVAGVVAAILIVGVLAWAWVDLLVSAGTADEAPEPEPTTAMTAWPPIPMPLPDPPAPPPPMPAFTAPPVGRPTVEEPWIVQGRSFDPAGRERRQ